MSPDPLLRVQDLTLEYLTGDGPVAAVDQVSFELRPGQALGLVGESGCGKTTVANCLLRLLPENARVRSGRVLLGGEDILGFSPAQLRELRGNRVAMVFQAAMNSLNPVYRVGDQIIEAIRAHRSLPRERMQERLEELYELVGLDPAVMWSYPHEYSGGMRQRAVIAMALCCDPDVLVADEPTTALDVIVQRQILRRLARIHRRSQRAMILVSHDLAAIAQVCDHVAVMYAGQLIESGPTDRVLSAPIHRYTRALLDAVPRLQGPRRDLAVIGGEPPDLLEPPPSCRFHPRCRQALPECRTAQAPRIERSADHWALCFDPCPEPA
ncbi:MAG: ABC transporter ATP-binding protein [Chloroflexi bacterium]|nr:ABC transporter ATP-binding protein [Chloroflexota bacterium]MYC47203.1 ABC transporter ATP-binding protein [Chloroflexota bacterium]